MKYIYQISLSQWLKLPIKEQERLQKLKEDKQIIVIPLSNEITIIETEEPIMNLPEEIG